jgi:hypothetical protein
MLNVFEIKTLQKGSWRVVGKSDYNAFDDVCHKLGEDGHIYL